MGALVCVNGRAEFSDYQRIVIILASTYNYYDYSITTAESSGHFHRRVTKQIYVMIIISYNIYTYPSGPSGSVYTIIIVIIMSLSI